MKNDIKQKKYTDKPLLRVVHKRQHQTGGGVPKDDITYKAYLVKVMGKWEGSKLEKLMTSFINGPYT